MSPIALPVAFSIIADGFPYIYTMFLSMIVPFEEDEKDPSVWFLDHNYVEAMNDMFKKVNGKKQQESQVPFPFFFCYHLLLTLFIGEQQRKR